MAAPAAAVVAAQVGGKFFKRVAAIVIVGGIALALGIFVMFGALFGAAAAAAAADPGRVGGMLGVPNAEGWVNPTVGSMTSPFGELRGGYTHDGQDISAACGTPILAPADGVVVENNNTWDSWGGAYVVILDHGGGIFTMSAHNDGRGPVIEGQLVTAGQVVAYVGNTGMSTGCHNHHTVWMGSISGTAIDPVGFYSKLGIVLGSG